MAKPERRDLAKERYWRGLLRQWRRSGLTGRDFCGVQGLSEPSFYAWRREIAKRDRERLATAEPGPASLASLARAAAPPTPEAAPAFVRVALAQDASADAATDTAPPAIELVVSARRVLRVRPGFDADLLRQLVRLLEEPTC